MFAVIADCSEREPESSGAYASGVTSENPTDMAAWYWPVTVASVSVAPSVGSSVTSMPAAANCRRHNDAAWADVVSRGTSRVNRNDSPVALAYSSAAFLAAATSRAGGAWSVNHGEGSLTGPRAIDPWPSKACVRISFRSVASRTARRAASRSNGGRPVSSAITSLGSSALRSSCTTTREESLPKFRRRTSCAGSSTATIDTRPARSASSRSFACAIGTSRTASRRGRPFLQ